METKTIIAQLCTVETKTIITQLCTVETKTIITQLCKVETNIIIIKLCTVETKTIITQLCTVKTKTIIIGTCFSPGGNAKSTQCHRVSLYLLFLRPGRGIQPHLPLPPKAFLHFTKNNFGQSLHKNP